MTTAVGHDALRAQLLAGSETLGLGLTDAQVTLLMDFQALLQKWNKVYNLTAVRDPQEMMTHHLLDSLAAVAPLRRHAAALAGEGRGGVRLLDVGSGGGLPGVVFAICCPEVDVSCVDTVARRRRSFSRPRWRSSCATSMASMHGLRHWRRRLTSSAAGPLPRCPIL